MPKKQIIQISTDILMTGALLLLMSYGLLGEAAHEWVGMGVFALFILHHVLNRRWLRNLTRGRYTPYRVLQTGLVLLVLLTMLGAMLSGILLSRTVFRWMHIRGLSSVARTAHMLCSYWGFVFVSLHLGFHWSAMSAAVRSRLKKKPPLALSRVSRLLGLLFAGYGLVAFFRRDIGNYMLLRYHFVFFDFDEPLILFLFDYLAVLFLFAAVGYALCSATLKMQKNKKQEVIER